MATAQLEVEQSRQEIRELVQYADSEARQLNTELQQLHEERDRLQLQVWDLEEQLAYLTDFITAQSVPPTATASSTSSPQLEAPSAPPSHINLSQFSLALVGGHPATRRAVFHELSTRYGLKRWVEVPPFSESTPRRDRVKAKIQYSDLIVIITGYMNHTLTETVYSLKEAGVLTGEVILLNCRGKSGVVREILQYVAKNLNRHTSTTIDVSRQSDYPNDRKFDP